MLFSIIVPVYNVEKYLAECVNSILSQDFQEYEIILVDDGSKDSSGKICDFLEKNNECVKVIHKKNGGLSDARNCGVKIASGDYLLFIDSDDYISMNSLKIIEKTINKFNLPDIICLECVKIYEDSSTIVPMNDGIDSSINGLQGDNLYQYLANLNKFPASACTKAINRNFFIKNNLFFEVGKLSEDLEWGMRLFMSAKKIVYCSVPYYNYRQARNGSISTTASENNMFHIIDTIKKGCRLAEEANLESQKKMIYSFVEYIYRLLILGYSEISKENKKKYKDILKEYKYVLGTRNDKRSIMIRVAYNLLGIEFTSILLKKYISFRIK